MERREGGRGGRWREGRVGEGREGQGRGGRERLIERKEGGTEEEGGGRRKGRGWETMKEDKN